VSNIASVVAWLDKFVDGFDMQRQIGPRSLGRDLADKAVQCIQHRSLQERTGFGTAWPPNSEKLNPPWQPQGYKAWKEQNYGTREPNSRTGQMLSKENLYGRTTIESKQVTLIYGTNQPPTRAAFGTPTAKQLARPESHGHLQGVSRAHGPEQKESRPSVLSARRF
jgi:hypothetical protein